MTPGTGKRSYRACLRCRRRKTRCNLDGVGEAKKPPCVSCHHSGSECVLVGSRRGGNFYSYRGPNRNTLSRPISHSDDLTRAGVTSNSELITGPQPVSQPERDNDPAQMEFSGDEEEDFDKAATDEDLRLELRNPSDALQILARSDRNRTEAHEITQSPGSDQFQAQDDPAALGRHRTPILSCNGDATTQSPRTSLLDDYELVQRGLLHMTVVPELLSIYSTFYHPYCPIVPKDLLGRSALETIQRPDYFLLTVILTIASRDSPNHSLIHRYCWDYTQRLLLEVLLAQPWTQTPRTVEGLLLLSEWLPHIQISQTASQAPKSLFSEDRTAWSLIGLAVRHGYMLRLDRAAFRYGRDSGNQEQLERNRLIWTFIYVADRQISVRLGQSFWSRGPAHSSNFTASDFPSLSQQSGTNGDDYAAVLEATTDLTQLLHNAHNVLYSSRERTLSLVYDGDYGCYLDDFQRGVTTWYAKWHDIPVQHKIKSIVFLMYEYVCLYVNAFSFQAVLTRASNPRGPPTKDGQQQSPPGQPSKKPIAELFSRGIMSSPDGRFVFDAISAAKNLLSLINGLDPRQVVRYLPSRYYLYGVYAAVFLHKAQCAGAFDTTAQRKEVARLARRFIDVMAQAPATESHICHGYSRMLRNIWSRRAHKATSRPGQAQSETASPGTSDTASRGQTNRAAGPESPSQRLESQISPSAGYSDLFGFGELPEPPVMDTTGSFPSIDGYLFGSFLPGLADFSQGELGPDNLQQDTSMPGLTDAWGAGLARTGAHFSV